MTETTIAQPEPKTEAEYKAAIEAMFEEMARIDERIARNQAVIKRSQEATRSMLDRLKSR